MSYFSKILNSYREQPNIEVDKSSIREILQPLIQEYNIRFDYEILPFGKKERVYRFVQLQSSCFSVKPVVQFSQALKSFDESAFNWLLKREVYFMTKMHIWSKSCLRVMEVAAFVLGFPFGLGVISLVVAVSVGEFAKYTVFDKIAEANADQFAIEKKATVEERLGGLRFLMATKNLAERKGQRISRSLVDRITRIEDSLKADPRFNVNLDSNDYQATVFQFAEFIRMMSGDARGQQS